MTTAPIDQWNEGKTIENKKNNADADNGGWSATVLLVNVTKRWRKKNEENDEEEEIKEKD